jgi:acyl-coenzyme A synthetase/AMP-(fatty) acid ligase
MNQDLACNLIRTLQRDAHSPALKLGDGTVTYAQLDDATVRIAGLLRQRGIEPGDRVGIMLPNVPQFAIAYYGVLRAGAAVVPMNVLLKEREVAFYLGDPEASSSSPGTSSPRRRGRARRRRAPSAWWWWRRASSSSCWRRPSPSRRSHSEGATTRR